MAKTGYIYLSRNMKTAQEDRHWMEEFGCDTILEEDCMQEKLRPLWRQMLGNIHRGDEIVVSKLSNALRGIRELGAFLDLCGTYRIRIVSIHDGIDTAGELYPSTTAGDILYAIGRISSEAAATRKATAREITQRRKTSPRSLKAGLKIDREKTVISMYESGQTIDEIWKISGYRSRTSVFRVLARNGVQLNRGRHHGPIKKENE